MKEVNEMDDVFKHLREWQKMINQLNYNQEMIDNVTSVSNFAHEIVNSNVVANYMDHASAMDEINTVAHTLIESDAIAHYNKSSILDLINNDVVTHIIDNQKDFAHHDLSSMASAVADLNNQNLALSNTYEFAPFLNHLSSVINSSFLEDLSEYIRGAGSDVEETKELSEEDVHVKIKRPHFFNIALKINIIVNVTNAEVQSGKLNKEEERTWKRGLLPILTILGQLFLAWAMSDTPLHETNIYKSIENIIHYVQTLEIDIDQVNKPNSDTE